MKVEKFMNDLQVKEFELLKCFIEICEKLNLKYYLLNGSALGAIRHNGFIPWDDDVDVGLMREDYEAFLDKAPSFLPGYFFLQNYKTDPCFPAIYSKLRNSDTTFVEKSYSKLNINHGIYIDIFPLDGYPQNKMTQFFFEIKKKSYKRKLACAFDVSRGIKSKIPYVINIALGYQKKTNITAQKYEKMLMKYSAEDENIIANHGNWQGKLEYCDKSQYGNGFKTSFEGLSVTVPEKYDEYLTQKYGDYMELPAENERIGHHYYSVLDVNKPYNK